MSWDESAKGADATAVVPETVRDTAGGAAPQAIALTAPMLPPAPMPLPGIPAPPALPSPPLPSPAPASAAPPPPSPVPKTRGSASPSLAGGLPVAPGRPGPPARPRRRTWLLSLLAGAATAIVVASFFSSARPTPAAAGRPAMPRPPACGLRAPGRRRRLPRRCH